MVRLLQVAALAATAHAFVPLQRLARPVQTSRPWALWASDGDDEAPKIVAEEAEDSGPEPGEEGYEAPEKSIDEITRRAVMVMTIDMECAMLPAAALARNTRGDRGTLSLIHI